MSGRSKFLTWGLPLIGVGALGAGAWTVAADRPMRPAESPPRQPTTAPSEAAGTPVAALDARAFIGAIGITEPPGEAVLIGSHVAGVVEEVAVTVGDAVQRGDALFTVDSRRARRDVELRRSELSVALAEVEALRGQIDPARARVAAAEASVASAEASVQAARADLEDRENLLRIAEAVNDPRAISQQEVAQRRYSVMQARGLVAQAEAQTLEAKARVAETRASLALLVDATTGGDGPDVRTAVERAERSRAELQRAETELDLLTVRSSVDGDVLQVNVRGGEFAPANSVSEGLVVLGRTGPIHVRVQIDEVDIPRFSRDAAAWASPRADAQRRFPMRVAYVEPLVVPKTNLSGRTSELVDTRVLEVVYELAEGRTGVALGQQLDVFIAAEPMAGEATP